MNTTIENTPKLTRSQRHEIAKQMLRDGATVREVFEATAIPKAAIAAIRAGMRLPRRQDIVGIVAAEGGVITS